MISVNNTLKLSSAYIATRNEKGGFKLKQISKGTHTDHVYNQAVMQAAELQRNWIIPGETFVIRANDRYGNHRDVFEDKIASFMAETGNDRDSAEAVITSWAINNQNEFNRLAS